MENINQDNQQVTQPVSQEMPTTIPPQEKGGLGSFLAGIFAGIILLAVIGVGAWYMVKKPTATTTQENLLYQADVTPTAGASATINSEANSQSVPVVVSEEELDTDFTSLNQQAASL